MAQKDYYEILGIKRDATEEEIKKAFRKKSMEFHPDRHVNDSEEDKKKSDEKFKEINEAHSVLSDPEKRKNYDLFGSADVNGFDPFEGFDPFGGFNAFRNGFKRQRVNKGEDIVAEATLTEKEAFMGVKKDIEIKRSKSCSHCNGTGSSDGKDTTCPYCHGSGRIRTTQQQGNMTMIQETMCPHCHGKGKIISNPCPYCHGTGLEYDIDKIPFEFPAGIFEDATIIGEGLGNSPKGNGINGDLYVNVHVKESGKYQRNGDNVITKLNLTLEEAWCGCDKIVYNVDNAPIKIHIPELTPCGKEFVTYGKGYTNPKYGRKGNFVVIVNYEVPKKLNKEQKELLKKFYELGK